MNRGRLGVVLAEEPLLVEEELTGDHAVPMRAQLRALVDIPILPGVAMNLRLPQSSRGSAVPTGVPGRVALTGVVIVEEPPVVEEESAEYQAGSMRAQLRDSAVTPKLPRVAMTTPLPQEQIGAAAQRGGRGWRDRRRLLEGLVTNRDHPRGRGRSATRPMTPPVTLKDPVIVQAPLGMPWR